MENSDENSKKLRDPGEKDVESHVYNLARRGEDRILNVENETFFVQSERLVEVSEYFRALFTHSFKEFHEEQIELKGVDPAKLKVFLDAIFYPATFPITDENVKILLEMSLFFQSDPFLVNFLKEKKVWKVVKVLKLLDYAKKFGNLLLIMFLDEFLVSEYGSNRFNFSERASFDLINEYGLNKLLYISEKQPYIIVILITKIQSLKDPETLEKDDIETFLMNEFKKSHSDDIIKNYLKISAKFHLDKLKDSIEQFFLDKIKAGEPTLNELSGYVSLTKGFGMFELLKVSQKIAGNNFMKQNEVSEAHINYSSYLDFAVKNEFKDLKTLIEDHLIQTVPDTKYSTLFHLAGKYNLDKLKNTLSAFYSEAVTDYSKDDLAKLLACIQKDKIKEVKNAIDNKLTQQFINNPQLDYLEMALQFDLISLTNAMKSFLSTLKSDSPFIKASFIVLDSADTFSEWTTIIFNNCVDPSVINHKIFEQIETAEEKLSEGAEENGITMINMMGFGENDFFRKHVKKLYKKILVFNCLE